MAETLYGLTATLNNGQEKSLSDYRGKVLLVVNTASQCGFTPQYQGLQDLYARFRADGFEVLGFPCDQFGHQEPGTDEAIQSFCQVNFGVEFPLFRKIDVNGENAHPLYKFLKERAPGLLGRSIRWNFTKFLVSRDGQSIQRFAPNTVPAKLESKIQALLTIKQNE
jgi:glutathione peroxidase